MNGHVCNVDRKKNDRFGLADMCPKAHMLWDNFPHWSLHVKHMYCASAEQHFFDIFGLVRFHRGR